ncbi:MAG: hypothetical protein LQ343_007805 [Gyalolechia ehrenbergii]|nr:MAG: hypothetical protein LQ343_007805 [Gyalolechia ehrenbergii]
MHGNNPGLGYEDRLGESYRAMVEKSFHTTRRRHHLATPSHDLPQPSRTVKEVGSFSWLGGESVAEREVLVSKFCDQDGGDLYTRPPVHTRDKSTVHRISKKTEKEPGMSNAQSDFTDGIRANLHQDIKSQRFSQRIPTIFGVVPYITHPSLVVEGKKQQRQQGVKKGQERAQEDKKEEEDEEMTYETYNTNQMSTHLLSDTEHVQRCRQQLHHILNSGRGDRVEQAEKGIRGVVAAAEETCQETYR